MFRPNNSNNLSHLSSVSSFAVVDLAGATVECNRRGPPGKPRRLPHVDRPVFPRDSKMFCSNTVTTNPSEKIQLENDRTCVLVHPINFATNDGTSASSKALRASSGKERKGKGREGGGEESRALRLNEKRIERGIKSMRRHVEASSVRE